MSTKRPSKSLIQDLFAAALAQGLNPHAVVIDADGSLRLELSSAAALAASNLNITPQRNKPRRYGEPK